MGMMVRGHLPAMLAGSVITAALLAPMAAQAQDPLGEPERERDRERCICFDDLTPGVAPQVFSRGNRARLGIMLGNPADAGGQRGVRVEDVVEGGPADRAGIAAGDIIVAVGGVPLGSEPTRRLLELMSEASPGDTVAVRFSREGAEESATVVLGEDRPFSFRVAHDGDAAWSGPDQRALRLRRMSAPDAPSVITIDAFGHGGLELVEVNEALGRYFGVDEGVLVADVAEDSRLGLQPGDVLVSIDGREVQSPRHARSIIGSYLPDEEMAFQVVRDRRTITVRGSRGR